MRQLVAEVPVTNRSGQAGRTAALLVLRAYKLLLSPFFTGACRHQPSCSDYAAEAVIRYGVARGGWLALKRLGRCHPFGSSGYDPVPARWPTARGSRPQ